MVSNFATGSATSARSIRQPCGTKIPSFSSANATHLMARSVHAESGRHRPHDHSRVGPAAPLARPCDLDRPRRPGDPYPLATWHRARPGVVDAVVLRRARRGPDEVGCGGGGLGPG